AAVGGEAVEQRRHAVVRPRVHRQALPVRGKEARERLVEIRLDLRAAQHALDEQTRALADHRHDDVGRQRPGVVGGEHGVGGIGKVLPRIDQRSIEVEDEVAITHASTLHGSDAGGGDVALLCSGGIDSIVLAADLASGLGAGARLHPLYVRSGLSWEQGELEVVARALAALPHRDSIRPLVTLDVPIGDLYPPDHWALTGQPPAYDTPDEDVYLVGRNVTLLAKAAVHCALH